MDKQNLEYNLNKGNIFGYNIKNDAISIGWVILSKRFPIEKFFERFKEADNPEIFKEQMKIKNKPYNIWIAELKKEVYEGEKYPRNEDYIINENHSFSSLAEAEEFLIQLKLYLVDIKWSSEIEFL